METLNLNLIPTGANPVAHVSQYDEGRVIRFNLFEGSAVYTLDGTETIECDVKKPDGNVVTLGVTNTSDSYVEVTTTLQTCACAGESLADIKITKGAVIIATLNFILDVERSPLENGIESDSAIHNLETQIAEAVADQYDADSVIFDNTPTAGHGIGYAVTSEGIESAIPKDLDDLSDVTYTGTPAMGEAVVWDGSKWTNGTVSTVGSIDDLNDVDTTGKAEGDSLRYDSNDGEWKAKPTTVAMTSAEWGAIPDQTAWKNAHTNTHLVLTDAPNLNATAQNLSYDGGVTSTYDEVESLKTVASGTVSPQTGYTDNGSYIKKCGNLVLVHINFQAPSAISNRTWVGAISGTGMLPSNDIPFCGSGSATHAGFVNRVITGYIASNGGIFFGDNLSASNTAIDLFCDISYFV